MSDGGGDESVSEVGGEDARGRGEEGCRPLPPPAIVVGAGVAGLTAAHELAARGFKVHVIERVRDERRQDGTVPGVGGLARSEYSFLDAGKVLCAPHFGGSKSSDDEDSGGAQRLPPVDIEGKDNQALRSGKPPLRLRAILQATASNEFEELEWVNSSPESAGALGAHEDSRSGGKEPQSVVPYGLEVICHPDLLRTAREAYQSALLGVAKSSDQFQNLERQQQSTLFIELLRRFEEVLEGPLSPRFDVHWIEDDGVLATLAPKVAASEGGTNAGSRRTVMAVFVLQIPVAGGRGRDKTEPPFVAAGEHGYRFFPSFYDHLFATMKDIPLSSPRTGRPLGYRSVFDNLEDNEEFFVAFDDEQLPDRMVRRRPGSITELQTALRVFQRSLGIPMRDLLRSQMRVVQFMTSCLDRRKELERVSWRDFIRLEDGYSQAMKDAVDRWPQALVGLNSAQADARTFGNVLSQQLLDQLTDRGRRDATLRGPTSDAWLDHWKRHLSKNLRVEFYASEAIELYRRNDAEGIRHGETRVFCSDGVGYQDEENWPGELRSQPGYRSGVTRCKLLPAGAYLVLATPPHETLRLLRTLAKTKDAAGQPCETNSLHRLENLLKDGKDQFKPERLADADPGLPLRHFAGIQYFFRDRDVPFGRGHLYMPNSPWGLSGISQKQYRAFEYRGQRTLGTLSLVAGSFSGTGDVQAIPGRKVKNPRSGGQTRKEKVPPIYEATRAEVGDFAWRQVLDAVAPRRGSRPSRYGDFDSLRSAELYFQISRGLVFGDGTPKKVVDAKGCCDKAKAFKLPRFGPYHTWHLDLHLRPAHPGRKLLVTDKTKAHRTPILKGAKGTFQFNNTPYFSQPPLSGLPLVGDIDENKPLKGYDVEQDNLAICGSYTATFTRLGTMEAANESAKHAVNGILRQMRRRPVPGRMRAVSFDSVLYRTNFVRPGDPSNGRRRPLRDGFCDVLTMEEREPEDLNFFKDIDEKLFHDADGRLPHLFDILKVDDWIRDTLAGDDEEEPSSLPREDEEAIERACDALVELAMGNVTSLPDLSGFFPRTWLRLLDLLMPRKW